MHSLSFFNLKSNEKSIKPEKPTRISGSSSRGSWFIEFTPPRAASCYKLNGTVQTFGDSMQK